MGTDSYPLVDLLQNTPAFRIDPQATDTALVFCFSGSTTGGLFADALGGARLPESTWEPEGYAQDLFVQRFVLDCLQGPEMMVSAKHLTRIILNPPQDLSSVEMRRSILEELVESSSLRQNFTALYQALRAFREGLEGTGQHEGYNARSHQIDLLRGFTEILSIMAEGFEGATSALSRVANLGQKCATTEGYQSLLSFLSYEGKVATLDFRVQMGSDGRVRQLDLLKLEEEGDNPFVAGPLRRWGAKLELFLRGFRFSDGEVMARLIDAVFEGVRPYFVTLIQLMGDVEFYVGALRFRDRAMAAGLQVCLPEFCAPHAPRKLQGLFNPLLLGAGMKPVPCTIESDRHDTTLLVTGPNSGGKTRLLQAVGYCQLLAQSGLFVPAQTACIALSPGLVVSLIQETAADQTEGRLGVELMRIRSLFERLPAGAIVILDELCSGTNPSEGEEIFELVVRMLAKLRPQAFITTHFLEFASRLQEQKRIEGLRFLQVVLGSEQQPTYQFAPGVASTSLASHAAARLGVTGEQLLALIDKKLRAIEGQDDA